MIQKLTHRIRLARALSQQKVLGKFLSQQLFQPWWRARWARLEPGEAVISEIEPGVRMKLTKGIGVAELIYLTPMNWMLGNLCGAILGRAIRSLTWAHISVISQ
ncbi:MAG TPA: hypothetical protein VHP83_23440 [Aggregatilineaceae bacterium]|nr:hypothetical protein [Aggregatilineaceae bacterium]